MMELSEVRPFKVTGKRSYHRRSFSHDYFAPFIYHIIIKKAEDCESFGSVEGNARITPGITGCAKIKESYLGKIIAKTIVHLPYNFPIIKLHQFCVMPDHVHLLLQVLFRSTSHLDFYIEGLKSKIAAKYSKEKGTYIDAEAIFEIGYCDKPLYNKRSLDGLYRYIRENPHRLAMRQQFPQFFQRVRKLKIANYECEAYGNLFLLRNPDKEAIRISSKFTPQEKLQKRHSWLDAASKGTILVSPFISLTEKAIRTDAEAQGAKIIYITHEAFPERYKPSSHDFKLCEEGRLLIISLRLPQKTELTRSICLQANELAKVIAQKN